MKKLIVLLLIVLPLSVFADVTKDEYCTMKEETHN